MKKSLFVMVALCLVFSFSVSAEEAKVSLSDIFAAPAPVETAPAAGEDLGEVLGVELVFDEEHPDRVRGEIVKMSAGCTATALCFHGGSVTCSTSYGTCTVSYAQCGWVQCGTQPAVRCAGSCAQDWHCYTFCGGDFGAFCAWDKCCECS